MNIERIEFGSDFHMCDYPKGEGRTLSDILSEAVWYYDGRQALEAVCEHIGVKRLWMPSYYCHSSIAGIRNTCFYNCNPFSNPDDIWDKIDLQAGDAVLRMNYFGLYGKPGTVFLPAGCRIIEDHSHDLTGEWAKDSDAEWCFASIRKTMPVAEGGVLWSPKGLKLPESPSVTQAALQNSARRYAAMSLKADYLKGVDICKDRFLAVFGETEDMLDRMPLSDMSRTSKLIVSELDMVEWNRRKRENYHRFVSGLKKSDAYEIVAPSYGCDGSTPFSVILLFRSMLIRDEVRRRLIKRCIYPAILWTIPDGIDAEAQCLGNRILSVHCDGRYTLHDMDLMAEIFNEVSNV